MGDIVHQLLNAIADLGYWGIMIGLAIEIIPSEIVLSYGGFLVSQGSITFLGAVLYGAAGIMIAQVILYWIGRYGGRPFVEKYGKYLLIKDKHLDLAEGWFNRYGAGIVFTSRFIPVLRQAVSIPAGMARMPLLKFSVYTLLATIPWSVLFIYFGKTLGENWQSIHEKAGPLVIPFMIGAALLAIVYFSVKSVFAKKNGIKQAGKTGEQAVAHQLKFLGSEYKVLNAKILRSSGSYQQFDHVVIGPNGIFHIETKHWSGRIAFTKTGVERDGERGTTSDPTAQMYRHEYILKEIIRENKLPGDVVGILCFSHPQSELHGKSPAFMTVKLDRLVHSIRSYKPRHAISDKEISRIYRILREHIGKPR